MARKAPTTAAVPITSHNERDHEIRRERRTLEERSHLAEVAEQAAHPHDHHQDPERC